MSWDVGPRTLAALAEEYVADLVGLVDDGTRGLYRLHLLTHLVPHFRDVESVTTEGIASYGRARLKRVKRPTLVKERATLRGFLGWCRERGYLTGPIELPTLSKRAEGTPYELRRRGKATPLEPDEARAIVAKLPFWSSVRGGDKYAVRPRFVVAYETALRPGTLDEVSTPEHYQEGGAILIIENAMDKNRWGRELPLNDRARAALDSVAKRVRGLLFGSHDYRWPLSQAAAKVLDPERAKRFTAYDLRHCRLTELAAKGDLPALAYLAGHRQVTTTAIYVRGNMRAAKRLLDEAGRTPASQSRRLVGVQIHESLPVDSARERTRTSTGVTPLAPQGNGTELSTPGNPLENAAVALLRAASDGVSVSATELYDFARLALSSTETGRLALAVLDGGAWAPRRALELAALVCERSALPASQKEGAS